MTPHDLASTFKYTSLDPLPSDILDTLRTNQFKFNSPQALEWQRALDACPKCLPSEVDLTQDILKIGQKEDLSPSNLDLITAAVTTIHPWRKGPYTLFGTLIDSEWQCQLKWNRLAPHLPNVSQKTILDIGCNSGYFSFKLAGLSPKKVIAIDPTALYYYQFHLLNHYINTPLITYLPIGFQDIQSYQTDIDIILNMGILYHHPHPIEMLKTCKSTLKKNGLLVLETLYIEGTRPETLTPIGRYAGMKNISPIPTIPQLYQWIEASGFSSATLLHTSTTSLTEQRSTPHTLPHSLKNVLTPDLSQTIEGYPPPKRALLMVS